MLPEDGSSWKRFKGCRVFTQRRQDIFRGKQEVTEIFSSHLESEAYKDLIFIVIFKGLYQKAEALYYMGEFEFALVFYHRGQKLRPQIQEFRLGIQKAQEAIENSVGSE